jgi:hypothetical protein
MEPHMVPVVLVASSLVLLVGALLLLLVRRLARPVTESGNGWTLEPHKTNPGDKTGKRGRGPTDLARGPQTSV